MNATIKLSNVIQYLQEKYPLRLAEPWDNVGLLIGDPEQPVERIMTCLTMTPQSCWEAIERNANLIISHHPFPFKPIKRITTETPRGQMIWDLVTSKIALYSPHTAHDSAADGINQQIAKRLGLQQITTLYDDKNEGNISTEGTGRIGFFPEPIPLSEVVRKTHEIFNQNVIPYVGDPEHLVQMVAIGCGTAGGFLDQVAFRKADVFLVGETKFHQFLEAEYLGISLILPGHYATERFSVEKMADLLALKFSDLDVWASRVECDPVRYSTQFE